MCSRYFIRYWVVITSLLIVGNSVAVSQDLNYVCAGGFGCDFQFTTQNGYPEITIFSGRSTSDYSIPLNNFIAQSYTGNKSNLIYTVESGSEPFRRSLNNFSNLVWDNFVSSGSKYAVRVSYADKSNPNVSLGIDTLHINVDTAAPKFHYRNGIDTMFIGTQSTQVFRTPQNVIGANEIVYTLIDSTYVGVESTPIFSWVGLDSLTGKLSHASPPTQLGSFTYHVQAVRKSGTPEVREVRTDGNGIDSFTIFVVDSPIIIYRDTTLIVGSASGKLNSTIDLKGINYDFSIVSILGDNGRTLPANTSYSLSNLGVFSWTANDLTSHINNLVITIQATTSRYGGKTLQRTFRIHVIDTPSVVYTRLVTRDFGQEYTTQSDSIVSPTSIDWRGDTGTITIAEVSWGYTLNGEFVDIDKRTDGGVPTGITFNPNNGEIGWNRATPAYEYRFKLLARNDAGIAPKLNTTPVEDTARFTLLIKPGSPTIRFVHPPATVDTFIYGQDNQSGVVPLIDWKGTPVELRRDSFVLDSFYGSLDRATYGSSKEQSRIGGSGTSLLVVNAQNAHAGQLVVLTYPSVMRSGSYFVRVYVWSIAESNKKGSALDTIFVKPVAPTDFGYQLNTTLSSYNSYLLWRAYYYGVLSPYPNFADLFDNQHVNFHGEVIDSGNVFNSNASSILLSPKFSDGGDTVRFVVDSIVFSDTREIANVFSNGFSLGAKDASFEWDGRADTATGNISDFDNSTRPLGKNYKILLSVHNSVGSASDSINFEIFRPRPILKFAEDRFYVAPKDPPSNYVKVIPTFYKPIDGTTVQDTTISPLAWPGENNGQNWKYLAGKFGGFGSYDFQPTFYQRNVTNSISLDTFTNYDKPMVAIRSGLARGGLILFDVIARNSYGSTSIKIPNKYGIIIVDTPKGNQFAIDTIKTSCGFVLDSNYLSEEDIPDTSIRAGYFGSSLNAELVSVSNLSPTDLAAAISITTSGKQIGKVKINESRPDGSKIFIPGVSYVVTMRLTNALTRGESSLPQRSGAADTVTFVLQVQASPPILKYPIASKYEYATIGGSIASTKLEWSCVTGKVRLFNHNRVRVVDDSISIDSITGTLSWNKNLKVGEYRLLAVAINSAGHSDTSYFILRIADHPPTNLSYNPNTISISYGVGDSSVTPTINWYGNVGNFVLSNEANTTLVNQVSINIKTGVIYFSSKIPIGTYTLTPKAINIAGQTDTNFTFTVLASKPIITYPFPSTQITSGDVDSVKLLESFDGGAPLVFTLENEIQGITINPTTGTISWNKFLVTGTYNLSVIATNGSLSDTATLQVIVAEGKYTSTASTPTEYILFPNPVTEGGNGTLRFSVNETSTSVNIRVLNLFGLEVKNLFKQVLKQGQYELPLNFANLSTGLYILEIQTDSNVHRKRMVIAP